MPPFFYRTQQCLSIGASVVGYFDFAADLKVAIANRVAEMNAPTIKRNPVARNNWPFNVCLVNRKTIIFAMKGTHKIAK